MCGFSAQDCFDLRLLRSGERTEEHGDAAGEQGFRRREAAGFLQVKAISRQCGSEDIHKSAYALITGRPAHFPSQTSCTTLFLSTGTTSLQQQPGQNRCTRKNSSARVVFSPLHTRTAFREVLPASPMRSPQSPVTWEKFRESAVCWEMGQAWDSALGTVIHSPASSSKAAALVCILARFFAARAIGVSRRPQRNRRSKSKAVALHWGSLTRTEEQVWAAWRGNDVHGQPLALPMSLCVRHITHPYPFTVSFREKISDLALLSTSMLRNRLIPCGFSEAMQLDLLKYCSCTKPENKWRILWGVVTVWKERSVDWGSLPWDDPDKVQVSTYL